MSGIHTAILAIALCVIVALFAIGLRNWRRNASDIRFFLIALFAAGLACRIAFVFFTPIFHAPDEQSHLNYIKHLSETGSFPVLTGKLGDPGDEWENHQSPLYYIATLPIYRAAEAAFQNRSATVLVLRICSVGLWLVNAWLALTIFRRMQITEPFARVFAFGMICLLPTYTFVSSAINNDNLLITFGGVLALLMTSRAPSIKRSLAFGVVLGLALLTKQSAIIFAAAWIALIGFEAVGAKMKWAAAVTHIAMALGLAALIYLPWALRNWRVYHTFTPENLAATEVAWPSFLYGFASSIHNVLKTFWAVSGISNDVGYPFPLAGMLLLLLCFTWYHAGLKDWKLESLNLKQNGFFVAAFIVALLVNFALVLQFGYRFGMGQGRHLFPLLIPIALMLGARVKNFRFKNAEWITCAAWIFYASAFCAFSLARFPR